MSEGLGQYLGGEQLLGVGGVKVTESDFFCVTYSVLVFMIMGFHYIVGWISCLCVCIGLECVPFLQFFLCWCHDNVIVGTPRKVSRG